MTWFKVDDDLNNHAKARKAGLPAMGLWALAGSWAASYVSEGFVPEWYVDSWKNGRRHAAELVSVGLWSIDEENGDAGWRFHDWNDYQPSKDEVEKTKAAARERQRRSRERRMESSQVRGSASSGVTGEVTGGVTPSVTRDNTRDFGVSHAPPTRPDPTRLKEPVVPTGGKPPQLELLAGEGVDPFDEWWAAYPRSEKKADARKAYAKVIKTMTPADLLEATKAHAFNPDARFIPHPTTWLNGRRWEDESPQAAGAGDDWVAQAKANGGLYIEPVPNDQDEPWSPPW